MMIVGVCQKCHGLIISNIFYRDMLTRNIKIPVKGVEKRYSSKSEKKRPYAPPNLRPLVLETRPWHPNGPSYARLAQERHWHTKQIPQR